ncbi:hypothetical protein [Streptomyces thioluteus]|uniref:hypothetical protein n=1 Tax=Streptomyces thioluteus TaxID=66431 RepID=UPI0031EE409B
MNHDRPTDVLAIGTQDPPTSAWRPWRAPLDGLAVTALESSTSVGWPPAPALERLPPPGQRSEGPRVS